MHPAQSSSSPAAKVPAARTNSTPTFWPSTNSTTGPRLFTHSPYLTTGNIIVSEDLDAVEFVALGGVDGQRSNQGSPITSGPHQGGSSFNASSNSANQLHSPHGYSNGKKNVCRHFINGNCNRGSSCRFYHPGPIHRVITPTRPRTPTQRPLTPLADLAQHNSASAAQSPAHSPHIRPTSVLLFSSPRQSLKLNSGGGSARSNPESFASPLSSPSTSVSAQRSAAFAESPAHVVATAPALSSPSFGPQFSLGSSLGARARCWPGANPLPSLQLPEYLPNGIDDGTAEACISATGAGMGPLSRPHSPSSPGPYRLPVYCAGVQLGASSNSGRGERRAALASPHHHRVPGSRFPAASSKTVTSPRRGGVTRNNPYAYSPTRVRPQLSQPMSPLKRTANEPE
ncbi:hypothetical protein conserved [Leishmania donovani]|uniref:Hypothetical_protein_conserved n=1 Tax=Leishmania donovani TaxID=5661 RepID=A0A504X0H9_LEIDO|nr:hypothetical protein CGC20_13370 [Leishmania donovani]CAJ1990292.1 hypothetical protein conserved [Leishmania donovani]VDZ46149.1 hypothetical_protein_conserved [Leishmania donovani]